MSAPFFFSEPQKRTVGELAQAVDGELHGNPDTVIAGVAPLDDASEGAISFMEKPKYLDALKTTKASAVLLAAKYLEHVPEGVCAIVVGDAYRAYAQVSALLYPEAMRPRTLGFDAPVHPTCSIHPHATLEDGVIVEPNVVVGEGAQIGAGSILHAGCVIGAGVRIGRKCNIGNHASIEHTLIGDRVIIHAGARLGQDGFGFAPGANHIKVPQLGRVIIQDDVEIGANTAVDRGTTSDTVIGEGTKIDNLVQIGHNCVLGRHCFIVANVGLAGSTIIGDYVTFAGGSASAGHLTVGSFSQVAGMAAVAEDLPPKSRVGGIPAVPIRYFLQQAAKAKREAQGKRKGKNDDE
jgi:UDP-3-O-[3-hydroxymyristoyl] glucosamine N-acyltransferase